MFEKERKLGSEGVAENEGTTTDEEVSGMNALRMKELRKMKRYRELRHRKRREFRNSLPGEGDSNVAIISIKGSCEVDSRMNRDLETDYRV